MSDTPDESYRRFMPTPEMVRLRREQTGDGLVDSRRWLVVDSIVRELHIIDAKTENEQTLKDALLAMIAIGAIRR